MAKGDFKEKKVKKNKYLTDAEVDTYHKMSNQELLKEYLVQNRAIRKLSKMHKEDQTLADLNSQIKNHRETTVSDKIKDELKKLKDKTKEIKDEIDIGLEDVLDEVKTIKKDQREDKGHSKEALKLLQFLLDKREA